MKDNKRYLTSRNKREGWFCDMTFPTAGHKIRTKNKYATQKAYSKFCKEEDARLKVKT